VAHLAPFVAGLVNLLCGITFRKAKSRPGRDLGQNNADLCSKSLFEQAVKILTLNREVEQAKCHARHELGHKNRATVPEPILALGLDSAHEMLGRSDNRGNASHPQSIAAPGFTCFTARRVLSDARRSTQ
jgi:hypothetical protein